MIDILKKIAVLTIITSNCLFLQGQTDTPCSSGSIIAPNLPINASCVITNGTSVGSTGSINADNGGKATCRMSSAQPDVWYSFVAPPAGAVAISVNPNSSFDEMAMAVYSGTCGAFTQVLCDDDGKAMPMHNVGGLTPGQTYFIRLWDPAGSRGTFEICLTEVSTATSPACSPSSKAGETCATATPICDLNGYCGDTKNYAASSLSGFCASSIDNDSFLKFVATSSTFSFNFWITNSSKNLGVQLMVFKPNSSCSGAATNYFCKQVDVSSYATVITVDGLTPGDTYHIMVDGYAGDLVDYVISATVGLSAPVNVTPATSSVCIGQTVNLTASGGNGTYTWNASPHLNTTTGANVVVTPPASIGTYTYTVNSANGNPLCPTPSPKTATINVIDCACTVTASNSGYVCNSGTFNLSATNVTNASSYTWSGPGGFTSNQQNPSGVNAVSGKYTVTVTSPTGSCTASTDFVSTPPPLVSAGKDTTICLGNSTSITASGASSYTWDNGLGSGSSFVVTPTSTTIYSVTGTDANGCSNTATVQVIVNSLPTVDAGTDFSICQGQTATLSGNGAQTYTWDNGVTNSTIFTPSATTTFTVTGTDANGCTGTDQITITLNPNIPVNAGADRSICTGQTVTLLASGTPTISWDNGVNDGVPFTPTNSGTYTVTGTSSNGCVTTDQVDVFVNPIPILNITNPAGVCAPATIDLTSGSITAGSTGGGTLTYWTDAAGTIPLATPNAVATSGTYYIQSANGSCSDIEAVIVTLNNSSTLSITNPTGACTPATIDLTSPNVTLGSSSSGTLSYWTDANGTIPLTNPNAIASSGTYYIKITDGTCSDIKAVNVVINNTPSVSATDVTICQGETATLVAVASIGGGTFMWSHSGQTSSSINVSPSSNTSYDVTYSINGCQSAPFTVNVTLTPLPIVTFIADTLQGCVPLTVTLTNTSGSTTCNWNLGNGVTLSGCTVTHQFNQAGCFDISLTANNGTCKNTSTMNNYICVESAPSASFNFTPNSLSENQTVVNFNNTSIGANSYYWDFGDNTNSTLTDPLHDYHNSQQSHVVTLTATSLYGCTNQYTATIGYTEDLIFFVPNSFTPDGDLFNQTFKPIFTSGYDPYNYNLTIFNRWGEIIFESNNTAIGWDGSYGKDGKHQLVQDGIYTWEITFKIPEVDDRKVARGHVSIIR